MEEPNRFVAGPKPKTDPCPFSRIKIPSFFSSVNHSSTHPFPYSNPMTTKTRTRSSASQISSRNKIPKQPKTQNHHSNAPNEHNIQHHIYKESQT
jgi:hypothetical protein